MVYGFVILIYSHEKKRNESFLSYNFNCLEKLKTRIFIYLFIYLF